MNIPNFEYYEFVNFKGIVMGYPLNPHPQMITIGGLPIINPGWVSFANFSSDNSYQVADGIPAGKYKKEDIQLIKIGDFEYYSFYDDKIINN